MKQPFELDVNVNEIDNRILQVCAKAEEEYINATRKNKIGVNSMNDVVNVGSVNSVNIVNANTNVNVNNNKQQQQYTPQSLRVPQSSSYNIKQIHDNTNILSISNNIISKSKSQIQPYTYHNTPNFKLYNNTNNPSSSHKPQQQSIPTPHSKHISTKQQCPDLNRTLLQAKTLMKKYKFTSALDLLSSAVHVGIYHSDLFYLYGEVNRILKHFQPAEDYLLLALNFEMHSPYVFYSLGLLYQELSQFKYSNSFFKLFLQLINKADVHFQMAKNYSQIGKYIKAAEHLTKAIEGDKECVEYYRFRAEIYRVIGLTEMACDDERMVEIVVNSNQRNYG